jgi:hypothetical protein
MNASVGFDKKSSFRNLHQNEQYDQMLWTKNRPMLSQNSLHWALLNNFSAKEIILTKSGQNLFLIKLNLGPRMLKIVAKIAPSQVTLETQHRQSFSISPFKLAKTLEQIKTTEFFQSPPVPSQQVNTPMQSNTVGRELLHNSPATYVRGCTGLPDGIFENEKYHFWYILEGLGRGNVGIFSVH